MSKSYNTQDTKLFPNTKVFTGVVLQHRGKILLLPFPSYHNKKKYAKYEIMILYFVIFERFYRFSIKMISLVIDTREKQLYFKYFTVTESKAFDSQFNQIIQIYK